MTIPGINPTADCMASIMLGKFQYVRFAPEQADIPLVNMSAAFSSDAQQRQALAFELGEICRTIGFFAVENHGLPQALLDAAQQQIERFFNLPLEVKNAIHIGKSEHHRGYVPWGEEKSLGGSAADIKEVFDMARELPLDHPRVLAKTPFHGPNVWPEGQPQFRASVTELFDRMLELCSRMSSLFAICFGLPESYFDETLKEHLCEMRLLKYPPQPAAALPGQIGCGEHTDYGIVSALWQIDRGGLEVQRRDGAWINVRKIEGAFICVLGDMTARWTNDSWQATRHRVVNNGAEVRHSVAFFCDPSYDCVVEPMPQFVSASNPPRYAPTTMGAHMERGYDGSFQYRAAS